MTQRTAITATTRNNPPTIQCRVQKHAPAARKISVAAMTDSNSRQYCTRYWMEAIP